MHTANITVLSVRQDGAGFKANLPDDGEQWLSLPDTLHGQAEWKKDYLVSYTKTPKRTGGFFYNVKSLAVPGTVVRSAVPPTNGNGSPVPHSYKDLDIATAWIAKVFAPIMVARELEGEITVEAGAEILARCEAIAKRWWRSRNKAAPPPPPAPTNIEDTF